MVLNTDHYVYVKSDEYSWRPGKLLDQDGTTATVSVPKFPNEQDIVSGETNHSTETLKVKLADYPNKTFPLQNVDEKGEYYEEVIHELAHRNVAQVHVQGMGVDCLGFVGHELGQHYDGRVHG